MRYELKYAIDGLDQSGIEASVMMHPASFTLAYDDRQVNNIYLDSPNLQCFYQNIEGQPRRKKMRLRWYGNHGSPTEKSVIEIKNKDAELGWKDSYPLNGSEIKDTPSLLANISSCGLSQGDLIPILHNSYQRAYYISQNGLFRITIDTEQSFKLPFSNMSHLSTKRYPIIVELKYEASEAERAREITDYLPFRQTKNSKYTTGVQELWF